MTIELNPLAVANADALRALDSRFWANRADFARHVGKDPKNITRDLRILADAGLVEAADNPDFPFTLTAAALDQLAAIARAEHGGDRRKARGVWPLDRIRPNPKNRTVDPESIDGMADSLAERGQLQPVLLSPPDAHGVRMILAGERRWLGALRLRDQDRRVGLGWVKRPSNSGAGTLRAALDALAETPGGEAESPLLDVQVFALPNPKPGWKGGPLIQIEVGRIEGQGWIAATEASYANDGWGEPFHDCPANAARFDSLEAAVIAAVAKVRRKLPQYGLNVAQQKQAAAWLDQTAAPFFETAFAQPEQGADQVQAIADADEAASTAAAALLAETRAWMAAPDPDALPDLLRRLDCPSPVTATERDGGWLNGRDELVAQFDPGGDLQDDQAQAMAELTAFIFAEGLRRCLGGAVLSEPQAA